MCRNCHCSQNGVRGRRLSFCLLFTALCLVFFNAPASAHKVTIFAWVEGDTVHTQSKIGAGKRAKGAQVLVFDSEGNQLLEGKTDEKGEFSFKIPKKADLKVVLKASMGHMAEWKIPADEIGAVGDVSGSAAPEINVKSGIEEAVRSTDVKSNMELSGLEAVNLTRQEVQDLIDKSLDRKLAPIVDMLADAVDCGPKMTEVIGGIGYIFGLVGVALYFANRRKKE